ncbi:MAG: arginase [Tissierellia bacterium]|nr:arginase [Tissierellia bacterium]
MMINLIGVPIMYGSDRDGVQYGPDKLRQKGIISAIEKHNKIVYDFGNLFIPQIHPADKYKSNKKVKYLDAIVEVNENLAQLVYSSLCSQAFPFIVGGDHVLGLGSISGASKYFEELAVIWIDAHGDINTPNTSPSGNSHGMPLAAAMGIGNDEMINLYYNKPKIKPENVYIIGARDLDQGEIQLSEELNLKLYTMDKVREMGINKVIEKVLNSIRNSNVDGVHLSFDIDALDKSLVPGTGTPVEKGFTLEEGKELLRGFLETDLIKSMDLVELNTYLDENNITADLCIELIDWIFNIL